MAGDRYTNYQSPYNNQQQSFFLQPQGNVYMIGSSYEISSVPVGNGVSAAICPNEQVMYLKSIQNGNPVFLAYSLMPYNGQQNSQPAAQAKEKQTVPNDANHKEILSAINGLSQRIDQVLTKGDAKNEF